MRLISVGSSSAFGNFSQRRGNLLTILPNSSVMKTLKNFSFDDEFQYKRINNFFDNDEQCYFITELDSIHIFKASVRNIIRIIGECSFFEYYVLDLGLDKLLCETEHGDLLFL